MSYLEDLDNSSLWDSDSETFFPSPPSNGESVIVRLPPEVLALIFIYVVEEKTFTQNRYYKRLYRLPRVCSHWRDVAGGTPSLWAFIHDSMEAELLDIALARSCTYPLDVFWTTGHSPKPDDETRFLTVMQHIYRWEYVTLVGVPTPTSRELMVTREAPRLRSLCCRAWGRLQTGDAPFDIFGGTPPLIKNLDFHTSPVPWGSDMIKGLRELLIHNPPAPIPTTPRLLNILSQCPRLTHVRLSSVFCDTSPAPESFPGRISLLELQTLALEGVPRSLVHAVLQSLDAPHVITMAVKVHHEPRTDNWVARECWLLAIAYLRNKPGVGRLAVWVNHGLQVILVEHYNTVFKFKFEQLGYSIDISPALSVRDLVEELERNWGPISGWKMARSVVIDSEELPRDADTHDLELIAPKESFEYVEEDSGYCIFD